MQNSAVFGSLRGIRTFGRNVSRGSPFIRTRGKKFCSIKDGSCSEGEVDRLEKMSRIEQYDIAIVGGGMVGMAFACAISRNPVTKHLKVAIVDNNPALESNANLKRSEIPDPRVSTVTPATISFFRDLGAWEYVEEQRHAYFDKMQVWDYTGLGYTRYNARDAGKRWLGCVVENKVLHYSLISSFKSGKDLQWKLYPAKLTSLIVPSPPSVSSKLINAQDPTEPSSNVFTRLDLNDGNSLLARLVIGADGSNSKVREMAGLKATQRSYFQSAIICSVEHAEENDCAWQRFLPSGPIALLPIGGRFSNVVWTMQPDEAASYKAMPPDQLAVSIDHALGHRHDNKNRFLEGYIETIHRLIRWAPSLAAEQFMAPPRIIGVSSERMVFPLSLMHAQGYVARRVVLVGDAAHTVHPLAGQGVNLGFADAAALARVVAEGVCAGSDIGEINLLRNYEKERKSANKTMMAILDGFQKAFSVDAAPLNLLRSAAFHGANYIPFLKRNIISYASGDQKWPIFH